MAPISRASANIPIAAPRVALWLVWLAEAALLPRLALNCWNPPESLALAEAGGDGGAAVAAAVADPVSVGLTKGVLKVDAELNGGELEVPLPDVPALLGLL